MDLNLQGKVALVCGASQGIGAACANVLAHLGASIVIMARNLDRIETVLSELDQQQGQSHYALVADFSQPKIVNQSLQEYLSQDHSQTYGKPCILINNTGGPAPGQVQHAESQSFMAAFEQHLINNHQLAQALLPGMKALGYGRIINIISTSVKQPLPGLGVSNTIRGAVANWAKTLANEVAAAGITVNNVLPGATSTARLEAILENKANKQGLSVEAVSQNEKAHIPANRFGLPEEVANAVAFLASPAAAYINGINLPVDGGRTTCL